MLSKILLSLLSILILLTSCRQQAKHYPYLIKIANCPNCFARLHHPGPIDTAKLRASQLVFVGTVRQPDVYRVFIRSNTDTTVDIRADVYLPADSIQITLLPKDQQKRTFYHIYQRLKIGSYLRNATVFSTSPQQKDLERYLYLNDSIWNKYFVDESLLTAKLTQTYDSGNRALVEQWSDSARRFRTRFPDYMAYSAVLFAKQHPHSELTAYALLDNTHNRPDVKVIRPYYRALPDSLKQSYFGQQLAAKLEELQQ
ncbi:hypothetical protein F1C16_15845 [Hymenobacter sp. NBH84]|uniref:hypothetical protein n=1 Tax=Hymenobacter sp. NBH84 TaxID=2596915 RepID=UPI001628EE4C|nr:hypothetical protein [Hymenobacter sp. NBH84]QNE40932.1 hypothetical protein F1C16_15845 [Hymenobacter sp. NBH84]